MRFVSTYTFKPYMSREENMQVLARFAEVGNAPGVTDHMVYTDGTGGVVIGESDDITGLYRNVLAYSDLVTFDTHIALTAEEAVPEVAAVASS